MKGPEIESRYPAIRLVEPDVERDSVLGAQWLEGSIGRDTLRLMGVPDRLNKPSTLEHETQRVTDFIERDDQLNWMLEHKGQIVGSVWVDLKPTDHLHSPALHIMIGNPLVRREHIGYSAANMVLEFLGQQGYSDIYSRYLIKNWRAKALLDKLDFNSFGPPYKDNDNLEWQNAVRLTTIE